MIRRRDIGGGAGWCDVAGDVFVYALPASVVAVRIGGDGLPVPLWTQKTPEPLMFLRAALGSGGRVVAVGKGHDSGAAYVVQQGACEPLAPVTNGNNPIALLAIGSAFLIRWIEPGGIIATLWPDATLERDPIPAPWTGTATGLLDLAPDGSPIYMDAARELRVGAWTLFKPNQRGAVTVGQTDPPAVRVAVNGEVFTALEAPDAFAEDPHISALANGRLLVSAFTSRGASLAIIDPPYPPTELPPTQPPEDDDVFQKCEVDVDAFTLTPAAKLPDGTVMTFHDRSNPKGAHVRVWVEGGSCRMAIDYPGAGPGLMGETGARRPVR